MSRPRTSTLALAGVFVVALVTWSFVRPEAVAEPGAGTPAPVVTAEPEAEPSSAEPSPVVSPTDVPEPEPSPSPAEEPSPTAGPLPSGEPTGVSPTPSAGGASESSAPSPS